MAEDSQALDGRHFVPGGFVYEDEEVGLQQETHWIVEFAALSGFAFMLDVGEHDSETGCVCVC